MYKMFSTSKAESTRWGVHVVNTCVTLHRLRLFTHLLKHFDSLPQAASPWFLAIKRLGWLGNRRQCHVYRGCHTVSAVQSGVSPTAPWLALSWPQTTLAAAGHNQLLSSECLREASPTLDLHFSFLVIWWIDNIWSIWVILFGLWLQSLLMNVRKCVIWI